MSEELPGQDESAGRVLSKAIAGRNARWAHEAELLLLCNRPHCTAPALQRMRALIDEPLDWQWLTAQAGRHEVGALLYANLRNMQSPGVPAAVREELAGRFQTSARYSLYLLGELLKVIEQLEEAGIPVIPFKGPTLAIVAFGDVALREFSDLDLLVREQDIGKAQARLMAAGFHCTFMPEWQEAYQRFGHELDFANADGSYGIDLQWRFGKKWLAFPLEPAALWQRSTTVTIAGRTLRQPAADDYLVLLCGHAYRHCWSRLKWVSDVAGFIHASGEQIDWPMLWRRVGAAGGSRILALGLWLARELADARMPVETDAALQADRQVALLGQRVIDRLFDSTLPMGPRGSGGLVDALHFHLRARERVSDKLPRMKPLADHVVYQMHRYARHYKRRWLKSAKGKAQEIR